MKVWVVVASDVDGYGVVLAVCGSKVSAELIYEAESSNKHWALIQIEEQEVIE